MIVEGIQKVQDAQLEEGVLKATKLASYEVTSIIMETSIGSGILGLVYSARLTGWSVLLFWLVMAGLFAALFMLYAAGTALCARKPLQLPGLTEKCVGKSGSLLIFISICTNSIGCMIAYTTGSGNIICILLELPNWAGSLLFIVLCVLAVRFGLKATGIWEELIFTDMVLLLILIVGVSLVSGKADTSRAIHTNWTCAIPILSTVISCYIVQYTVPELAHGMRHILKKLPDAIMTGIFTTGILLALVPLTMLSLTGADEVTQVTTIAWGQVLGTQALFTANVFALCAVMISYWAVGGAVLTNIVNMFELKDKRGTKIHLVAIACTALPPFTLAYSGLVSFMDVTDWAGTFGRVIMFIVPVKMLQSARKSSDIEPEWQYGWYAEKPTQYMMIIIFLFGAVYYICSMPRTSPIDQWSERRRRYACHSKG